MAVLGRAAVELWLGQLAAAEASAQQALGVLQAIGDASWTSAALATMAEIERTRGRLGTAGEHAAEAIAAAERANSAITVMIATGHLGRILLARGEPGAAQHLDQAVQLARAFGVRPLRAWWLDSLGELAELEGRYDDAGSWYGQAAGHAAECGLAVDAARVRHHLGRLAWMRGDRASAVNTCHEALAGQLEAGDPRPAPAQLRRRRPAAVAASHGPAPRRRRRGQDHHQPDRGRRTMDQPRAARPVPGRPDLAGGQQPPGPPRPHQGPLPGHGFRARLLVPPRAVREAAARIPGCRYAELPGLGHGAPLLAAGQVNPILTEFLA
jgi:tetratricopeptide (TPR) repeat protein